MSYTSQILAEIRAKLAPTDGILGEARGRRGRVLGRGMRFEGSLRRYNSGSIAHGTANSDLDADCGVVLDRREYPELGPDGEGVGSTDIVRRVESFILDDLREEDRAVTSDRTKRAIQFSFHVVVDGFDPTVDLIVGLTRKDWPGLWIPNLRTDGWDPSHPEKHTELFSSGSDTLRRVRARAVRLAKGWNGQYAEPAVCSFNLEAIAHGRVTDEMSEAEALHEIFSYGAKQLADHDTPDPAEVSPPIKLLLERAVVVERFEKAAELMAVAIANEDDEEAAQEALAKLFWEYVEPPAGSTSEAAWRKSILTGSSGATVGRSGVTIRREGERGLKDTNAYGE